MSTLPMPHDHNADSAPLSASLVLLLATGAGLAVACLYYSQPMLGLLGSQFGVGSGAVGLVPTLTQLGYALGILLLAPLGDRCDRRTVILVKAALLCLALLLAAFAGNMPLLWLTSFAIGLSATLAQDLVPAAATLAPEANRGKVVGTVMTGLLLGILLSRVLAGLVAEQWGWRVMFGVAAATIALLALACQRGLPRFKPTTTLAYTTLLGSMLKLWQRYPTLRRAALAQALLSVSFSAFWSTLAVMLHEPPFSLGSAAAGAFGLAGAAGALMAPVAGRFTDRRGPAWVTRIGAALVAGAFAMMALAPESLWVLGLGAVVFDLGVQASLIAHQTLIYGLEPAARSRLNGVLFTVVFIGMASGAVLGSQALARFGWTGVCVLGTVAALGALIVGRRRAATAG